MSYHNTVGDASLNSFLATLGTNVGVAALTFGTFCLLRRRQWFALYKFFAPRKTAVNLRSIAFIKSLFSWIRTTLLYSDDQMFRTCGPDALQYIRFVRLCLLLCAAMTVFGLTVIVPINVSGNAIDLRDDDVVSDMGTLTIGNISENDPKLVTHVVFTFIYSFIAYALIHWNYSSYIRLRQRYLNKNTPRAYTVLVQGVPKKLRDPKELKRWFEEYQPCPVVNIESVWEASKLKKHIERRKEIINALNRLNNLLPTAEGEHPQSFYARWQRRFARICMCCINPEKPTVRAIMGQTCCGIFNCCTCCRRDMVKFLPEQLADSLIPTDAVNFYVRKLRILDAKIDAEQNDPTTFFARSNVVFVTFSKIFAVRAPFQPYVDPHLLKVSPAPDYEDVAWDGLHVDRFSYVVRQFLFIPLLMTITILWAFPFSATVALANLRNIGTIPGLSWVDDIIDGLPSPVISFIQGILPSLILLIFMNIMLPIIKFFMSKRGFVSNSMTEWETLGLYSVFLILNVFLLPTVTGTLVDVLRQTIDNPASIITLLAASLPQQSLYFVNYLVVVGIGRGPLKLFRIGQLIERLFMWAKIRPVTAYEEKKVYKTPPFDYSGEAGQDILVFCIVIGYSVMAPLTCFFGLVYFCIVYLVDKYNLIYANEPEWEGGGTIWQYLFHLLMTGILIFQLTMVGVLGLAKFGGGGAVLVLPLITVGFWIYLSSRWYHASIYGSLQNTAAINMPPEFENAYRQPEFLYDRENDEDAQQAYHFLGDGEEEIEGEESDFAGYRKESLGKGKGKEKINTDPYEEQSGLGDADGEVGHGVAIEEEEEETNGIHEDEEDDGHVNVVQTVGGWNPFKVVSVSVNGRDDTDEALFLPHVAGDSL